MSVLRNVGAVLLGMFLGGLVNIGVIVASTAVWPLPDGAMEDPAVMRAWVAGLPVAALLCAMAAHLAQAGLGGWIAARVSSRPVVAALIVGGLTALGTAYNILDLGGPAWMWLELPLDLALAGGLGWAEHPRRAP